MLEKVYEFEKNGFYFKEYTYQDINQLMDMLLSGNLCITNITVTEDCDVGLGLVGGTYSIDSFVKNYNEILSNMSTITFNLDDYAIQLILNKNDNTLFLASKNGNLEITDLISTQKKTL